VQPQELCAIFRENLRARRRELGLTQEELASLMKVDQAYVSDLERGKRKPNLKRLAPIAEALDTTPSALISTALRPTDAQTGASAAL